MTVILDDAGEQVLMMRRHGFIVDRWIWEPPGGYVDDGEDPAAADDEDDAPVVWGHACLGIFSVMFSSGLATQPNSAKSMLSAMCW